MRRTVALLLTGLLLPACGHVGGDGNGGTRAQLERQRAGAHVITREVAELAAVRCAEGDVAYEGLPRPPVGSFFVNIEFEPGTSEARRREVLRETARRFWQSDLIVLSLDVADDQAGGPQIDDVLGGLSTVRSAELEAAFGPKPPRPTPLPALADPGDPVC